MSRLSYTSRPIWRQIRNESPNLRRTHAATCPPFIVNYFTHSIGASHQTSIAPSNKLILLGPELNKAVGEIVSSFHQCASLKNSPLASISQFSHEQPPTPPSVAALALVLLLTLLKETTSLFLSYANASDTLLIYNKQKNMLQEVILQTCLLIKPTSNPSLVKRVDPVPGFQAWHRHISIELGQVKNPIAKKGVQEIYREF